MVTCKRDDCCGIVFEGTENRGLPCFRGFAQLYMVGSQLIINCNYQQLLVDCGNSVEVRKSIRSYMPLCLIKRPMFQQTTGGCKRLLTIRGCAPAVYSTLQYYKQSESHVLTQHQNNTPVFFWVTTEKHLETIPLYTKKVRATFALLSFIFLLTKAI